MNNKSFFKSFLVVVASIALFASCDKDFNQIGSDIIDDGHFGFLQYNDASVVAFNQGVGVVQTNNLPINSLGIYDNPIFGKTKANFVTQLQMATTNPTFDVTLFKNGILKLDSVVLKVPYFSHIKTAGVPNIYELDSISGNAPINLKVYENGYYLSDLEAPTFQDYQKYFNNQDGLFNANKGSVILNDSIITAENTSFVFSAKEYKTYKRDNLLAMAKNDDNVESRTSPRMALKLNKTFFENKILNAPAGKLSNNTNFKDYFRGLYFQVADDNNGSMMKMDFSKGNVTLYWKEYSGLKVDPNSSTGQKIPITFDHDNNATTPEVIKYVIKSFVLNMSGNTVNLLNQTNNPNYSAKLSSANPTTGDSHLYVKGGAEGSVALIDLFGKDLHGDDGLTGSPNGIADELDEIRNKKWLINDAILTFNIDKTAMGTTPEPQRVYLYDARNHRPVYDYATDGTTNANTKFNKSIHGGFIEREQISGGRGSKYKVRITNYIRNLVNNKDSTNVRLGLVVTESIGITANSRLKQTINVPFPIPNATNKALDRFPASAVMYQLGTILYGNNVPFSDPNYDKRLKLEIYYTKLN